MTGEGVSAAAPPHRGKENTADSAAGHVPSAVAEFEAAIMRSEGEGGARGTSTSSAQHAGMQGLREALRACGEENGEEAGGGWRQYKCRPDIVGKKGRVEFYDFTGALQILHVVCCVMCPAVGPRNCSRPAACPLTGIEETIATDVEPVERREPDLVRLKLTMLPARPFASRHAFTYIRDRTLLSLRLCSPPSLRPSHSGHRPRGHRARGTREARG